MKTILKAIAVFLLLTSGASLNAQNKVRVKVNPDLTYQTIEGWGASLCWWAHMAGKWDEEKLDEIIDLITSPDKLNMNIFRYNIGGGDDPSHYSTLEVPGHMAAGKGVRAEMEGFKDSEVSDYDWTRDAGQRRVMLKIKEKRPDAVFEAFSNSPPYWMTYSGCSSGNHSASSDNLKPEYYEAFCDYLIEVCKHYKDEYGIEFKTLEPFNEPLSDYWYYKGSQEGCHFDVASQIELIKILYPKLKASGLNTVISASDETNLNQFTTAMNAYMRDEEVLDMVGQLNAHTYSGSNDERKTVLELIRKTGKTFWQSETGPSGYSGLQSNVALAQKCFNDLRYMKPDAWLDWQLLEEHNDTWCQIRCGFSQETYSIVKNFYVRMQITRFIKQGYVIIDTNNDDVLAALNPDNSELVVCCINNSGSEREFSLDLSKFDFHDGSVVAYQTSSTQNCQQIAALQIENDRSISLKVKDLSLTTLLIPVFVTKKGDYKIFSGIDFEDGDLTGFDAPQGSLEIMDNAERKLLNNSSKALSISITGDELLTLHLEKNLHASSDKRYLHIMVRSDVPETAEQNDRMEDTFWLSPTKEWKDLVFELDEESNYTSFTFQSALKYSNLYIDNICINTDPEERKVMSEPLAYDFETGQTTPVFNLKTVDNEREAVLVANPDISGINALGRALFLQVAGTRVEIPDTLSVKLSSPLRVSQDTRYLHLMIKSELRTMQIQVDDVLYEASNTASGWGDLVVDLEEHLGKIIYELKLIPVATSRFYTSLYIDNICFDDNDTKKRYVYSDPEEGIPYIILNRKSTHVLSVEESLIQDIYDDRSEDETQQWILKKTEAFYTIRNVRTGDYITDQGSYYAFMGTENSDFESRKFTISFVGNGYVKIVSQQTGKALDVEGESTSPFARIGFWDYGTSGNTHRQWSFIPVPGIITSVAEPQSISVFNYIHTTKNSLELVNIPVNASYCIFTIDGIVMASGVCHEDRYSFPLSKGFYIVSLMIGKQKIVSKVIIP